MDNNLTIKPKEFMTAKEKALKINLDKTIYGSLAEIGAGQEVAANFFKAGSASGTVAKTMSAYDMKFSDAIYGAEKGGRYVCQSRLMKMLDKEFGLCQVRLPHMAESSRFFAYANTMATINFNRTNQGHGWMGVKFQLRPGGNVNTIVMHIQMHDQEPLLQQEVIGLIGTNLIYAAFNYGHDVDEFVDSLVENFRLDRVEIDFLQFSGADFEHIDNRLLSLNLVKKGISLATMFGPDGNVLLPADLLYKKDVLVLRSRFRPPTSQNLDMMKMGFKHFREEPDVDRENMQLVMEITLNNLFRKKNRKLDEKDFLDRADILCAAGQTVMVSNFSEYFRLVHYLSNITRKRKIGILLGAHNMINIFNEKYYEFLPGGILEAFGRLFGNNVKMYLYPSTRLEEGKITTFDTLPLPDHLKPLQEFLMKNNRVVNLPYYKKEFLEINSVEVLEWIREGKPGWEKCVPRIVESMIKEKALFGYRAPKQEKAAVD